MLTMRKFDLGGDIRAGFENSKHKEQQEVLGLTLKGRRRCNGCFGEGIEVAAKSSRFIERGVEEGVLEYVH